jgi:hypothetical protein
VKELTFSRGDNVHIGDNDSVFDVRILYVHTHARTHPFAFFSILNKLHTRRVLIIKRRVYVQIFCVILLFVFFSK